MTALRPGLASSPWTPPTALRVLHVIGTLDPAAGGPQAVTARLAAAEAALGHEVHIISYDDPEAAGRTARALADIPNFASVQRHLVPQGGPRERLYAPRFRDRLASILPAIDVAHLHGVWGSHLLAAAAGARQHRIPYCLCPHGMLDPWSLRQKRFKKALAFRLGYRAMLDRAAFLHVLNRDEMRLLSPLRLKAPMAVLPNGVFLEEFEQAPPLGSFRLRCPGLKNDPFVLFLGRLHYKKGLDYLIEAFARLAAVHPTIQLVVAGPDDGAQAALEATAHSRGCRKRVHLVGPLYGAAKRAALSDATCFCLPSRQEGFSVAILEALACGLPVVISEECRFPEVADHAAGEVVALTADAVYEALLRIVSDAAEARSMGANGRALVAERFVWPEIAHRALAAYRDACSPGAQTGTVSGSRAGVRR